MISFLKVFIFQVQNVNLIFKIKPIILDLLKFLLILDVFTSRIKTSYNSLHIEGVSVGTKL